MTTVVYKNGLFVADTLGVYANNGQKSLGNQKLYTVRHGDTVYAVGVAGVLHKCSELLEYISSNGLVQDADELPAGSNIRAIIVTKTKDGFSVWDACGTEMITPCRDPVMAIGSGAEYALGALAMNASPEMAVQIASKFNVDTNDQLQTLKWTKKGWVYNGPGKGDGTMPAVLSS